MLLFKPNIDKLSDRHDIEGLAGALHHRNTDVQCEAARALGRSGDARALEPLVAALGDESYFVRTNAATALGELGDPGAIEPLITALGDPETSVWGRAMDALRALGEPAVVPLIAALEDESRSLRYGAIQTLGTLGDARAVDPLIGTLGDQDWEVRQLARAALGKLGDARAVDPLVAGLAAENALERAASARALGMLGDRRAVEPLTAADDDADEGVRKQAAEALERLGAFGSEEIARRREAEVSDLLSRWSSDKYHLGSSLVGQGGCHLCGVDVPDFERYAVSPRDLLRLDKGIPAEMRTRLMVRADWPSFALCERCAKQLAALRVAERHGEDLLPGGARAYDCSGCGRALEAIGVPPDIQAMRDLAAVHEAAGGQVITIASGDVPAEVREDPYLYRGFVCGPCRKAFCPTCSHMQGEICPSCGGRTLLPAYRPLLAKHVAGVSAG